MTGYYDQLAGQGSAAIAAQGVGMIPSSTGEVLGAAAGAGLDHAFPSWEISRSELEQGIPMDAGEALGRTLAGAPTTGFAPGPGVLSGEDATAKYGVEGRLKWDAPVSERVAQEQSQRVHEDIGRESVIARREGGMMVGGAARIAAGLVGGLPGIVDPLNIAASFMPVVPETRAALWAARYGMMGRALTGGIEGAVGGAALVPFQAILAKQQGEDYGTTDALLNVALGGMFGGGLHTLIGARGVPGELEARVAAEIDRALPETREALARGALADLAEDRPVETPAETYDYIRETPGATRPYETVPQEPLRLASFLQREGGIRDEGGELAAGDYARARPGLINREGMSLDDAALRAWEEGYLPGVERPDTNTLLAALESDLKGHRVYSERDAFALSEHQAALERNADLDRLSAEHGIPLSGKTRDEFLSEVQAKAGEAPMRADSERLAAEHEAIMQKAEDEGWLPEFGENAPEDNPEALENAYQQETAARRAAEGEGRGVGPEAEPRAAGADEAGLRQGEPGTRPRRPPEPGTRPGEPAERLSEEPAAEPERALAEEITDLDREIAQAQAAGELPENSAELTEADEESALAEDIARACEASGACLGRRA